MLSNISQGRIDSSFVLAYYNPSTEAPTAWYPVPGIGSSGAYETRFFIYQTVTSPSTYLMGVRLMAPGSALSYANAVTFTKFKIVVVSSSAIFTGGRQIRPDWSNYNAVKKFLNLPE